MIKKVLMRVVPVLALLGVFIMMYVASQGISMPVVDTRGDIAGAQRDTLYLAVIVMLFVIVPVFVLAFYIPWRYRESNKNAAYRPKWSSHKGLEALWWGVPIVIVLILSVVTWQTSHSLDPYRKLDSPVRPINVQVVALQWRWLFIYPDENVAAIGEMAMPIDTPTNFTITSDAPMNSFWIPQLGGQIYAMAGMSTKLHLNARETGDYRGLSANLSGEGHAGMTFTAKARSGSEYRSWLSNAAKNGKVLDLAVYEQLRLPSKNNDVTYYKLADTGLYDSVVNRYSGSHTMSGDMSGMTHGGGH